MQRQGEFGQILTRRHDVRVKRLIQQENLQTRPAAERFPRRSAPGALKVRGRGRREQSENAGAERWGAKILNLPPERRFQTAAANSGQFWTAPAKRSDDGAFASGGGVGRWNTVAAGESGVALRFPPQSKTTSVSPQAATPAEGLGSVSDSAAWKRGSSASPRLSRDDAVGFGERRRLCATISAALFGEIKWSDEVCSATPQTKRRRRVLPSFYGMDSA
jgi:hypothetical protein